MARIAYYRVSTREQSIEAQRAALGGSFDKEFSDSAVSGAVVARARPGFSQLWRYVREGDELYVYAVDRLGRDSIDVQQTVRDLRDMGVVVHVRGLGAIVEGVGDLILAVLGQVAEMERDRIRERTEHGRVRAKELLETTGKTQHGKTSLGRPKEFDLAAVKKWREDNKASIAATAARFKTSTATVKRACAGTPTEKP